AGKSQLAHSFGYERGAQPVKLFERENVGLGQEGHVFRHAIDTPEIATVRDRYAKIGDGAAERIDHRLRYDRRCAFELDHPHLILPRHLGDPFSPDTAWSREPLPRQIGNSQYMARRAPWGGPGSARVPPLPGGCPALLFLSISS